MFMILIIIFLIFRSKTETKESTFKSITLAPGVVISKPQASPAKAGGLFGAAEPEGFLVTITEAGKPSLDLKIEGALGDANIWYTHLQNLCTK